MTEKKRLLGGVTLKHVLFYGSLATALLLAGFQAHAAEDDQSVDVANEQAEEMPADDAPVIEDGDEDWLNTVWTQVDDMVEEEEFKAQEIVTVAGVRGAEAEDNILAKLYYKGGKRYPSQDKLSKAIETLKKALAKNPKSVAAPKQKFFVAQCYEKLGNAAEASNYYGQIVNDHPKSDFADKAQEKLSQIATAK